MMTTLQISVKQVTQLAHIGEVALLFDAYRQFYGQHSDLAASLRFLSERFESGEAILFLAYKEAEPVGFAQLYPTFSSISMQKMWILNDLFVIESARSLKVGRALVDACIEHAKKTLAKGLVLETAVTNTIAQNLYQNSGWTQDTEFYRYYLNVGS